MSQEDVKLLRELLDRPRVLALGVLVDSAPYVGLLPFVLSDDRQTLLVHASALARHTRGLGEGAPFSALLHAPDAPGSDPLQIPRLTLLGEVHPLQRGTADYEAARSRYEGRFPESAQTFELGDFGLYALRVRSGRLVGGFGRARDVSPGDLASAITE